MRLVMTILLTRDISSLFYMFYWEFFDYEQYPKGVINTYAWDTPKVWYLVMNGRSYQWSGFEEYQSSTITYMLRPFVIVITEDQRIESQMFYDHYIYVNAKFDYEIGTIVPRFFLCVMPLRAVSLTYANPLSDIKAMLVTILVVMVHRWYGYLFWT